MNTSIRRTACLLVLAAFAAGLGGCNTMRGVGRDTAVVGDKIEKEADRHIDDEDDEGSRPSTPSPRLP